MTNWENKPEIKRFREYLKIPSVEPNISYQASIEFLRIQAIELDLPYIVYCPDDYLKPIVIITWTGTEPKLPTIILNSHMDVAPAYTQFWTHPPFAAYINEDGRIYARGAQHMKCVGMQYLEAIRQLKKNGNRFKRTIHITFLPDGERGSIGGMAKFVRTLEFRTLNVGFSLDNGMASPTDVYNIFYGERFTWHLDFKINGRPGHGSLLSVNTVGHKLLYIMNKLYSFRDHEIQRLENNPNLTVGNVTTINLTKITGGLEHNMIPPFLVASFDMRLAIDVNEIVFENQLKTFCTEAGGDIEIEYIFKDKKVQPTITDSSNPFWVSFKSCIDDELKLKNRISIHPAGTDSRYISQYGIPSIGFSPIINTPILQHDHNEYIEASSYLEGIEIYKKLITKLSNT